MDDQKPQPVTVNILDVTGPKKSQRKSRITVVEYVYHQPLDRSPTSNDTRFARWLETDEQPFSRRFDVGIAWEPIPVGWITGTSMLLLENKGKVSVMVGLEVGPALHYFAEVLPSESLRLSPVNLASYRLHTVAGETKCAVTLLPN